MGRILVHRGEAQRKGLRQSQVEPGRQPHGEARNSMVKSSRHGRFSLIVNVLLVALAFGLLSLVVWQNRDKIREVFGQRLDIRLLGLAFLISLTSLFFNFIRWFVLVRVIEPAFTLRATMLLGFIGHVFNLVIPGAVGGDLIKAAYLMQMNIRKMQAVASMVIDRIIGLLGLFLLAASAGMVSWGMATSDVRKLVIAAWVALGVGVLVLAAIFAQVLPRLCPSLAGSGHGRLSAIVAELNVMSTNYRHRLDAVLAGLGLSVISQGLNVLVFFLVGKMLFGSRVTATLAQHFLMVPLTLFTMAVPLPFGALGLTEGVGDQLLRLVGHPTALKNTVFFAPLRPPK